jgi:cytochrome b561
MLIVLRLFWRITHPVAPESSLPPLAASNVGGSPLAALRAGACGHDDRLAVRVISWLAGLVLFLAPLPMLSSESASAGRTIDGWHQAAGWALLVVIAIHVLAAMAHIFIYRDRIMQRMLP